jgi:hypothetical protein
LQVPFIKATTTTTITATTATYATTDTTTNINNLIPIFCCLNMAKCPALLVFISLLSFYMPRVIFKNFRAENSYSHSLFVYDPRVS